MSQKESPVGTASQSDTARRPSTHVRRRVGGLAVAGGSALLLAGCADTPLDTMAPESPIANEINNLFIGVGIVAVIVFILVQGAVIYMARRFRVAPPKDESQIYPDEDFPEQIHGNTRLEIGWTILPTVIMAVVAFFTLGTLFNLDDVSASDNRQIQKVTVVGQQWWWEFQYHLDDDDIPDIVTANELVLPVGEEIYLDVTSRDVIHSFWIPALNGKRDAVPGRTSPWTIEAGALGRFPGECTEFCGLSHAYMEKWVIGVTADDWQVWADNQMADAEVPTDADALAGWEVFSAQCASCHVLNGLTSLNDTDAADSFEIYDGANRLIDKQTQVSGAAPNLSHFASRSTFAGGIFELYENIDDVDYLDLAQAGDLNRGQLEAWITNAPEQKSNAWDSPTGQRGMTPFEALSSDDVDHLVAFLMTLD